MPSAALDYEIAQEMASALGRLGRAFEAALAALAAFDAEYGQLTIGKSTKCATRGKLVAAAGHALWCFIVQREACGLRDSHVVLRDYRVPPEVSNSMGALAPAPTRRSKRP
jgi:hypothetical protein